MNETILFFKKLDPIITNANYLHGVPNLNKSFVVGFVPDKYGIHFKNGNSNQDRFYLNKNDIQKISVEDQSSIESRIGFKRLLLVGIFAFAWKKRKQHPLSFLIFDYKDEFGGTQEMYIQSDRKSGFQEFTNIKYNLQKFWKEAESNPNFESQLRKIEDERTADRKYGNIIIFVVIILLLIFGYLSK